jgi:hypothetical protein
LEQKYAGHRFASYTYTDISPSFLDLARQRFAPTLHGRLLCQTLDISLPPSSQSFPPGS